MHKYNIVLVVVVGCWFLPVTSRAQNTNIYPPAPATKLEALETNTSTIIIKGFTLIGSLSINSETVSVTCKEDTDTTTGRKEHGIAVGVKVNDQPEDRMIIDYDEMDSLLNAIDYLSKISWSVTSLTGFDAFYATKGGFRVAAFGSKRGGTIEFSLRSSHMGKGILITPSELAQFRGLIDQARRNLDAIRPK
jgi:hypothetical protein